MGPGSVRAFFCFEWRSNLRAAIALDVPGYM